MLRFNRKTEYALLAVEHMALKGQSELSSAREISEAYHIPFPLLAKVMQALSNKGLIKASYGIKGGYLLAKKPEDISLANLVEIFDGPLAVAECFKQEKISCPQWNGCTIKNPFNRLNHKIYELLRHNTSADLADKAT
ncbi:MAG: Rrf2 family transcriptional regulator [Deltaproteobacteria bacterium]|nr:Rrf2 family transcriptional regulator [Deltaproteobacteria bacterium]